MTGQSANLAARLLAAADERGWGDRAAVRELGRGWTYGELSEWARKTATVLRQAGVGPGERVAILMPDSLEAAAVILGTMFAGAVAVPLSQLATEVDVRDDVADCGAVAAVVHADLAATLDQVRRELPQLRTVFAMAGADPGERDLEALVGEAEPAEVAEPRGADDVAFVLYSAGGGQGARRGVPHSHSTPHNAFESYARSVLHLSPSDRVFAIMRLSSALGLGCGLLFPLLAGAEAILLREQPKSDALFAVIRDLEPSIFIATPTVYGQLARDAAAAQVARPLARLRVAVAGAERMPPQVVERARTALGVEVLCGYDLTPAFQFVLASGPRDSRPGSCGRPVPGFEARVVSDEGQVVGDNEIGTLEIRGNTLDLDSRQQVAGAGGWLRTRDRFLVDSDGYFHHVGRVDDLFKVSGKWVTPSEVERALLAHEGVWECAVIGADDQDGLHKPLAFVVPNIGFEPTEALAAELREHVKQTLAPYKYPRFIEFVDELPKGPTGKVLRYKLQPPPFSRRPTDTSSQ